MFLWKQLYDPTSEGVLNKLLLGLNVLDPFSATLLKWVLLACWLALVGLLAWLPVKVDEMSRSFKGVLWGLAALFAAATVWPLLRPLVSPGGGGSCTDIGGADVTTDQRGIDRPQSGKIGGSGCDAGAYERRRPVPANEVTTVLDADRHVTLPKGKTEKLALSMTATEPLVAPVTKGQRVGTVKVSFDGAPMAEFPLVALADVPASSRLGRAWDTVRLWFK